MSSSSPTAPAPTATDPVAATPFRWWTDPFHLLLGLALLGLAAWILPPLIQDIAHPWRMNDDMRIWVGVYSNELPPPPTATATQLWRRFHSQPPGYLALAMAVRRIGDPWVVAKWGTLALWAAALVPLTVLARRVGGAAGVLAMLALGLHADVFIDRAAGSMPRGFAIPILAWMLYAITTSRPRLFLWLIPIGMLFYPPVVLIGGGAAVAWLLWMWRAKELRGQFPGVAIHAVLAFIACVGLAMVIQRIYNEGRAYTYAEALALPEMSERGLALVPLDSMPRTLQKMSALGFKRFVWGPVTAPMTGALLLLCAGTVWLRRGLPARLGGASACLLFGSLLGYAAARAFAFQLYVPDRMFFYSMPILVSLLWIACWIGGVGRVWKSPRAVGAGACLAVAGAAAVGGQGIPGRPAFHIDAAPGRELVHAVAALPPDSLISGPYYLLDTLYALAHRHMYLSYEGMQPFQPAAWTWMKARMWRHLEGYYAANWEAVQPLVADGVTHMLVYLPDLDPATLPEEQIFYEPFISEAYRLHQLHAPRGFVFAHPPPESITAQWEDFLLIDLSKVPVSGAAALAP